VGPAGRLLDEALAAAGIDRGKALPSPLGVTMIATVHPSSVLRAPDDDTRRREKRAFFDDVRRIRAASGEA
jgi:DNA polymerase